MRNLSLKNGMNTLIDTLKLAHYKNGMIRILLQSGVEIKFPVDNNPRLSNASAKELNHIEVSPLGLHWPDLDEDLSLRGVLNGNYGQ